jgi:hypothetical protein
VKRINGDRRSHKKAAPDIQAFNYLNGFVRETLALPEVLKQG